MPHSGPMHTCTQACVHAHADGRSRSGGWGFPLAHLGISRHQRLAGSELNRLLGGCESGAGGTHTWMCHGSRKCIILQA